MEDRRPTGAERRGADDRRPADLWADVPGALEPEDTPAEVAAAFRTQRRVAIAYLVLFLGGVVTVPVLNALAGWWTEGQLVGGVTPAFAVAGAGLYALIVVIGVLGARVADQVERRMLGGRELLDARPAADAEDGP